MICLTVAGKLFHTRGPAIAELLSPRVVRVPYSLVCSKVCLSVCLSVGRNSELYKTVEPIKAPFTVGTQVGPMNRVLDGDPDPRQGKRDIS